MKVRSLIYEMQLKLFHNCSYLKFSELFGKKQMFSYCSRSKDIIIVPEEISEEKLTLAKEFFNNSESWTVIKTNDISTVIMDCYCTSQPNSTTLIIQKLGGLPIYPVKYENNWEYIKIFLFEKDKINELVKYFEQYSQFEILRINEIEETGLFQQMSIISEIIDPLTPLQTDFLIKAFESGLYTIPRKIKTEALANDLRLSRYGFQKTLRLAENKLIKSLIPYLYFKKNSHILTLDKKDKKINFQS